MADAELTDGERRDRPARLAAGTAGCPRRGPERPGSAQHVAHDAFDIDPPYRPDFDDLPADRFLDRELSWLRFNRRVLELAEDPTLPLLERTRFLAIFASNLDEFFMVRVAGLKRRLAAGVAVPAASGHDAARGAGGDLARVTRADGAARPAVPRRRLVAALADENIGVLRWDELDTDEQKQMQDLFTERVFPVLTPLAVDPAHPFPYISGLSLNLAVTIRNPDTGKEHFARVKVPPIFPRFVKLGRPALRAARGRHRRPPRPALPRHGGAASTTRSASPATRTSRSRRTTPRTCSRRSSGSCSAAGSARRCGSRWSRPSTSTCSTCSCRSSTCPTARCSTCPGPLDLTGLHGIADLDRPELKYPAFVPHTHSHLAEVESASPVDMFSAISRRDVLLHHPYDSFATSVQRFIEQAAADPHVLAIKQTLYRTSGDSPIIDALIDAAESGKQVLVLVEIKARFDEQANIRWARKLEQAGCHVVYGLVGLKTHCKLALVVRDEGVGIRRYAHIGTGNYNPKTARMYEDLGLLTADEGITADISNLFNNLSGFARQRDYQHLLRRAGVRARRPARPHRPRDRAPPGRPARPDPDQGQLAGRRGHDRRALPRVAGRRAGRPVDRAASARCGLGSPGMSDNITVRSVLGRFLEHSRIFWFENGGEPQAWIGSADLMHRNLDRRVEVLVQIPTAAHVARARRAARPRLRRRHRVVVARSRRHLGAAPPRRRRRAAARPPGGADRACTAAAAKPRSAARR